MSARPLQWPSVAPLRPINVLPPAAALLAAACAGAAVHVLGFWALAYVVYAVAAAFALFRPVDAAFGLILVGVGLEPGAIDYSRYAADLLYTLPPGAEWIPLTTTPFEILVVIVAFSLVLRPKPAALSSNSVRLPLLVYLVPPMFVAGLVYGASRGGEMNIAYNEARGLIFTAIAFWIALRLRSEPGYRLRTVVLAATTLLAVIVLQRYLLFTRSGNSPVPLEFAYAHEDALLLAIGFLTATFSILQRRRERGRLGPLIVIDLLIVAAMLASGRRAASLLLLVSVLLLLLQSFRWRPLLMLNAGIVFALVGSAYLAVYWEKDHGAIAQPARAIRSQIAPNERDESSDSYREVEAANVVQTIRDNPIFGVGFGRPFVQYYPLPSLKDFWSLQDYTPHQNILWLWLKTGLLGITVFMSLWVVALKRCFMVGRSWPRAASLPAFPTITGCVLILYLLYARVDLALVSARSAVPLGVALALALTLKPWSGASAIPPAPAPRFAAVAKPQRTSGAELALPASHPGQGGAA